MRMIQMTVQFIVKLIWNKDTIEYEISDYSLLLPADYLYRELMELLERKDICGAENLLFERLLPGDTEYLKVAVDFYQRLGSFSEAELTEANFSAEEIYSGLNDIMAEFGLPSLSLEI